MFDLDLIRSRLAGQKVTVMGLGLLGRGVGDAAFLAECGAEVIVTDLKTEEQLASSLEKLKEYKDIKFTLGGHKMEDFADRDMILVAAGVPNDSPYLARAREAGARLRQSAVLFAELSGLPIIGVTGTRGKSTVTHLIHHVLSEATEGGTVLLGGNVRDVSNLQLLKKAVLDSIAVMELDSWQLQGFGWAKRSPQVAVFTNFMADHLNYYHGDLEAYFADKANIFLYQEAGDTLVTTPEVFAQAREFALGKDITIGQEVRLVDDSVLPEDCAIPLPGKHNRQNAALAFSALEAVGLSEEEICPHLATFSGLPGRLQFLRELKNGVKVYNDNNATTPQATIAALKALAEEQKKNLILIMGGADKNIPLDELIIATREHCQTLVLLPGTGTGRFKKEAAPYFEDLGLAVRRADSLAEAVNKAVHEAEKGDTILFSPAFASFGLFKNEYERNDQFVEVVTNLP